MSYTLYYKRQEKIIEVRKAKKVFQDHNFTEEVTRFNDCYFFCAKRKPLVEKAKVIKEKWIVEAEKNLKAFKDIEI